jgi:hypothetical protein
MGAAIIGIVAMSLMKETAPTRIIEATPVEIV